MHKQPPDVSRRQFLSHSAAGVAGGLLAADVAAGTPLHSRQATGLKVGEVTDSAAIVWMRLTAAATRNNAGRTLPRAPAITLPADVAVAEMHGACPGAPGRMRLRYGTAPDLDGARSTDWIEATEPADFSHQFRLAELRPATVYHYVAETTGPGGTPTHAPLRGRFQTAPAADQDVPILFTALSCSSYRDVDHPEGFHLYPAMAELRPSFYVHTGDNVYYDSDDFIANTLARARHHWHRMHSLPRVVAFHLTTPGYWEKDDHDCYHDDCWPGSRSDKMLPLTFTEGLGVFREQVPYGERPYRTVRWGRNLQVWFTEGRDYRTPNTMADGPDKTIWGREQKEWLLRTLRESRAEYKVLISPTPLVGPDRLNKRDNHSNASFRHEGDEFRRAVRDLPGKFFTICGDRHWKFHSVHPDSGLHEFGTGAASDVHAGGTPGEDPRYHRFHRVVGGFLSVAYTPGGASGRLAVRQHDVHGRVLYEHVM
jgi:alkaline phosphatase D